MGKIFLGYEAALRTMSAGATGAAAFVVQRGPLVLTALPEGSQLIITNPSALTTQLIVYRQ